MDLWGVCDRAIWMCCSKQTEKTVTVFDQWLGCCLQRWLNQASVFSGKCIPIKRGCMARGKEENHQQMRRNTRNFAEKRHKGEV